jgi:hypothetical protein
MKNITWQKIGVIISFIGFILVMIARLGLIIDPNPYDDKEPAIWEMWRLLLIIGVIIGMIGLFIYITSLIFGDLIKKECGRKSKVLYLVGYIFFLGFYVSVLLVNFVLIVITVSLSVACILYAANG